MSNTLKKLLNLSPLRHVVYLILAGLIFVTMYVSPSDLPEGFEWLLVIDIWAIVIWGPLGIASLIMNIMAIVKSKKDANITPFLIVHLVCMIGYEITSGIILLGLFSTGNPLLIIESSAYILVELAYDVLAVLFIVGSVKDNKMREEESAGAVNMPADEL